MSQQSTMGKKKLYPESNPGLSEKKEKPPDSRFNFFLPGYQEEISLAKDTLGILVPQKDTSLNFFLHAYTNLSEIKKITLLPPNCFNFIDVSFLEICFAGNLHGEQEGQKRGTECIPHNLLCLSFSYLKKPTTEVHVEINSNTKFITRTPVWYAFFILIVLMSMFLWTLKLFSYAVFQTYQNQTLM